MTNIDSFPERLRKIRRANGLTQAELAKKAGIGVATIIRYEKGERMPTVATLGHIANAFGITIEELLANVDSLSYDKEAKEKMESAMQMMADQLRAGDDLSGEMQANFSKLNALGKHVAVDVVEYLTTKEKYTMPDESPQTAQN